MENPKNNPNDDLENIVCDLGNTIENAVGAFIGGIKEGGEQLADFLDKTKCDIDRKRLCPFYESDLNSPDFVMPRMIRFVDADERRTNKACEGAIGFETNTKDANMLNMYIENADMLHLNFYPFLDSSVYYADPCHKDLYIRLDEYFIYLKKVRVDELLTVAQNLGAKHVKISLKEMRTDCESDTSEKELGTEDGTGNVSSGRKTMKKTQSEVVAEANFSGRHIWNRITEPKLCYFKNESDIKSLVDMRMNGGKNKILSRTYSFKYMNSSGIRLSDVKGIEGILKGLKCNLSDSFVSEAENENNLILDYSIEF